MYSPGFEALLGGARTNSQIGRACVSAVHPDGTVSVRGEEFGEVCCDVLMAAVDARPSFAVGQPVLVWHPGHPGARGVILGLITRSAPDEPGPAPDAISRPQPSAGRLGDENARGPVPDGLVLEAKQSLTLRVGDAAITLRADGKILITGQDLVSHARRLNRIKGGAVSIN